MIKQQQVSAVKLRNPELVLIIKKIREKKSEKNSCQGALDSIKN